MVRIINSPNYAFDGKAYAELAGLADDDKPITGLMTGSKFIEVDTGKEFRFDEVSESWIDQSAPGEG